MTSELVLAKEYTSDLKESEQRLSTGVSSVKDIPLVKEVEEGSADRSDSGMEEESLLHTSGISKPSDGDSNDEDDIGSFVKCKFKGKRRQIIDDDEDEEGNEVKADTESVVRHGATAEDNDDETDLSAGYVENADVDKNIGVSDRTEHDQRQKQEEVDSDENDEDVKLKFDFKSSDIFDAEDSDEDIPNDKTGGTEERNNNNSDEEEKTDDGHNEGSNDSDEGFDESEMSPNLLAKLKKMKGAAKSDKERAKYSRKAKPSAEKLLEIYSESQRLLRDSRVSLPYYEPQPKSLGDFLARAAKKKQLYAGLRRAKDFQKAQVIQDELSITPPKPVKHTRTKSRSDRGQKFNANTNSSQVSHGKETDFSQKEDNELMEDSQDIQKMSVGQSESENPGASQAALADDSGVVSQDVIVSQSSTVLLQSSLDSACGLGTETAGNEEKDGNELPDLEMKQLLKLDSFMSVKEVRIDDDVADWCKEQDAIVIDKDTPHLTKSEEISTNLQTLIEPCRDSIMFISQEQKDQLSVPSQQKRSSSSLLNSQTLSSSEGTNETKQTDKMTKGSENLTISTNEEDDEDQLCVPTLRKDPSRDLFRSQSSGADSQKSGNVLSQSDDHSGADAKLCSVMEERTKEMEEETVIQETPSSQASVFTSSGCPQTMQADSQSEQSVTTMEITGQEKLTTPKIRLTERLKTLLLPANPHLSGTPDEIICLDDPQSAVARKDPGLAKLMDRMTHHARKSTPRPARDVSFSLVQKEGEGDKTELILKSVTYHVKEEGTSLSGNTTGSKLALLKQQLGVGMRKKREESRQRRLQLYALENEEGFEREKEEDQEEEEEEEAELTDNSDSDEEEDEEEEDYHLHLNETMEDSDNEKDYNPLMDMEAKDDDDDNDSYEKDSEYDEDSNEVHLHLDVSDEEGEEVQEESEDEMSKFINDDEDDDDEEDVVLTSVKKKKRAKVVESDEENNDNIDDTKEVHADDDDDEHDQIKPNVAKLDHMEDSGPMDSLSMWSTELTPLTKHLQDTQPPQAQSRFRRENSRSPDLYSTGMADESESSQGRSFDHHNDSSQSFYNMHSQLLDADGYLKLTQTQQPPKSRIALLAQQPIEEKSNMGDLDSSLKMSAGNIFHAAATQEARTGDNDEDDENMRELMGLCSGTFGPKWDSEDAFPLSQNGTQSTQSFEIRHSSANNSPAHDSDVFDPFHILSDDEGQDVVNKESKWKKPALSDSEDGDNDDEIDNDGNDEREEETDVEDEEELDKLVKFTGFKEKKGIKREFLEEEAELSGSEAESDEDLDLAEEEDILEEEAGDRDMAGVSEDKLRDEVGRMHMKQLQDEDDREVMRFKEMYLQDGDLYSEGGGRMRNFRWKDMDDNTQADMFGHQSDEEHAEEDTEDPQWRKERYEREKFIESSEPTAATEDSQMLKLGQVFLRKKESIPSVKPVPEVNSIKSIPPPPPPKPKMQKKGSFLTRGKETLVKIAQITRGTLGQSGKNSRSFVFQTVESSETQDENVDTPQQPPKRKAYSTATNCQAAKKPKVMPTPSITTPARPLIKRQSSIFNLLEDK